MQAIVVDPGAPQRLGFQAVQPPAPQASEALIRVRAISLNRGEIVYRVQGTAGTRLGWDLAGVVEQAAADGSGPARGARVVGVLPTGAWAEQAAAPADALAELTPHVSFWEQYQDIILRTLAGVYVPARAVVPLMAERKHGSLIAVSSTLARAPYTGSGALAAGKASVEALLKALVPELGPHGIRVNVVAPWAVETEASARYIQARKEAISQSLPLRRVAQPEDIAAAILLLAMPQAGYLTGNYLAAGGGNYLP